MCEQSVFTEMYKANACITKQVAFNKNNDKNTLLHNYNCALGNGYVYISIKKIGILQVQIKLEKSIRLK